MTYLTTVAAKTTPNMIRLFANAYKPYKDAEFQGDGEYKMLDIVIANDGTPCTPRIKTLIRARLGDEWQLVSWWMPEPDDCTEFWITCCPVPSPGLPTSKITFRQLVMAKVVAPINARVEVIGKVKQGEYAPYRSVLSIDLSQPEGAETAKLWKSFNDNDETVAQLSKGSRVQLVPSGKDKAGKEKHNIVIAENSPTAKTPLATDGWTLEQKQAIAAKIERHSDLLRFCLETVQRKFGSLVEPQDIRALATTLFLQAIR